MARSEKQNITLPPDWWQAFKDAAAKSGQTVSVWLREAGAAQLPKRVREKLSEAPGAGRPRKPEGGDREHEK